MTPLKTDRRSVLKLIAQTASLCAAEAIVGLPAEHARGDLRRSSRGTDRAAEGDLRVRVLLGEPTGTIKPALYGQFAEHLGGVIYDGIWVGPNSKVPNLGGIRRALVEHVRRLGRVVVRWPGGCFADAYHWRDGIGPREKRPGASAAGVRIPNRINSAPMSSCSFVVCATSSPISPPTWVRDRRKSFSSGSNTAMPRRAERASATSGRPTAIANRSASVIGASATKAGGAAANLRPRTTAPSTANSRNGCPEYGVHPYLIASGPNGNDLDWTRRFLHKWRDYARAPLSGWAAHYYCGTTGHALKFSQDQWYEMLEKANRMEKLITDQWSALGEFDPAHRVKLDHRRVGLLASAGHRNQPAAPLRAAMLPARCLCAALTLDTFNRHADKIDMANVAQLVNNLHTLFLADGDKFVATPNFYVFEMYRPHHGAKSVRLVVDAPPIPFRAADKTHEIFRLAGSASVAGKNLTLTLVHTHANEPAAVRIELPGGSASTVRQTVLTHSTLNAHNTFENPTELIPKTTATPMTGSSFVCTLAPASVNRLDIRIA